MQPAGARANNDEARKGGSDEDVEGPENGVDDQTKDDTEERKNSHTARELLLILLCNRSLAHLK